MKVILNIASKNKGLYHEISVEARVLGHFFMQCVVIDFLYALHYQNILLNYACCKYRFDFALLKVKSPSIFG